MRYRSRRVAWGSWLTWDEDEAEAEDTDEDTDDDADEELPW